MRLGRFYLASLLVGLVAFSFGQSASTHATAPGRIQFAPAKVIRYPATYPQAITSGDFNNDGTPDLVAGDQFGGVYIALGRGDGTFGRWSYCAPAAQYTSALSVGKFHGKRNLDFVTNGISDAWVMLGNGRGQFPRATFLDADQNFVAAFAVGDFNGDGKPDIAALVDLTDNNATAIYLYLGNGDGTFQPARQFRVSEFAPVAMVAGDFNGDGNLDLAVLSTYVHEGVAHLSVLLGNGRGGFGAPIRSRLNEKIDSGSYVPVLAAADFNGDNKLDIAVAEPNGDSNKNGFVRVLLGNGDGTFRNGVRAPAGPNPVSIGAADLSGNGILDLVVSNLRGGPPEPRGDISVLPGNGDGSFRPPLRFPVRDYDPVQLTIADFNGDGKPDVATVNGITTGSVGILLNTTPFRARKASRARRPQH